MSYTYDVGLALKTLRLTMAVAPDGKLAGFDLRAAPRGNVQPKKR